MAAPFCYAAAMKKPEKPTPRLEDVELYPDAMERLERAIKTAVRHGPVPRAAVTIFTPHTALATKSFQYSIASCLTSTASSRAIRLR